MVLLLLMVIGAIGGLLITPKHLAAPTSAVVFALFAILRVLMEKK